MIDAYSARSQYKRGLSALRCGVSLELVYPYITIEIRKKVYATHSYPYHDRYEGGEFMKVARVIVTMNKIDALIKKAVQS